MAFWSKKITGPEPSQNPFRALGPEAFDRGEKINTLARELRRVAASWQLTESDTITALQTALGGEIAARVLRRKPRSPNQKLYMIDQLVDGVCPDVREAAYIAANLPAPPQNLKGNNLTEEQIRGLATRLLNEATKNNTPVSDALSVTAKALGLIIGNVVAEQRNVSADGLIKFCQNAVAEFAREAISYRALNK